MQAAEHDWLLQQLCRPLGIQIDEDQVCRLLGYVDLLQHWNATYNLTAVRDRAGMLVQHLADCLAVVPALQRHLVLAGPSPISTLLDVGSGGGLPGAVLAIVLPALHVTTIDTVGKKAAFVRQVAGSLALKNLHAVHGRVEAVHAGTFNLVTARAFSTLADLVRQTHQLLAPGGVWMAMKGKHPQDEIDALPPHIDVFHVEPLAVPGLEAERCLVWMRPARLETGHTSSKEAE